MRLLVFLAVSLGKSDCGSTLDLLSSLSSAPLIMPKDLPAPQPRVLDLAMILVGLDVKTADRGSKLVKQFTKMMDTIFLYSKGTPLRLIFLTDERSVPVISTLLKERVSR